MAIYKITDLKQGLKNPDRVNVFVDEKFAFSLDISQVVDFGIKVGMEISAEDVAEFKKASEFEKLYQRTLEWVLVRPRSIRETNDYLYKKIFEKKLDKNYIDRIIEKLKDKKYLDDYKFAEYYVENRFVKKGVSLKRLRMELLKKGISKEIIEEVLADSDRNDEEELKKMIAKKRAKYDDEKLTAYLVRQGFQYDLVRELVAQTSEMD
ncbi:RecX family transcriptional regulator [Candidatus Saccharibacteria bacterium]|nr:RecX family transcriptional regulator [Candidatus Saccharibacteria bacterium]